MDQTSSMDVQWFLNFDIVELNELVKGSFDGPIVMSNPRFIPVENIVPITACSEVPANEMWFNFTCNELWSFTAFSTRLPFFYPWFQWDPTILFGVQFSVIRLPFAFKGYASNKPKCWKWLQPTRSLSLNAVVLTSTFHLMNSMSVNFLFSFIFLFQVHHSALSVGPATAKYPYHLVDKPSTSTVGSYPGIKLLICFESGLTEHLVSGTSCGAAPTLITSVKAKLSSTWGGSREAKQNMS